MTTTTTPSKLTGVRRVTALLVALTTVLLGLVSVAPADAAPKTGGTASAPITGVAGLSNATLDITQFQNRDGVVTAVGTVTGTVAGVTDTVPVALPVIGGAAVNGSCEILDLVLGPLDLDLLGLVIQLDTVHLNITAEQGPGNLLGNLLCAVVGLLDGPTGGPAGALTNLLNRILGLLG
ncbi:hypothetical protein GCM10009616_28880 [Microlunatus lacustris]